MMVYGLVGEGVIGVLNTCNIFFDQKNLLPTQHCSTKQEGGPYGATKQEYIENVIYTNPTMIKTPNTYIISFPNHIFYLQGKNKFR